MPEESTTDLLQQLRDELLEALKEKQGVMILDVPLDQPPPEHEPEYEELTLGLDLPYPPPAGIGLELGRLLNLLFWELNMRQILVGDTRPPWGEPIRTVVRIMLDCQGYPVLLNATSIGPDYIRLSMTVNVDPDVL